MSATAMKVCRACGDEKPLAAYTVRDNGKGRRVPYADCKACRAATMRARYQTDPAYRERQRAWNREAMRRARNKGGAA